MRKILTFVCVALLMAGLCGCEKPDMSKLEGTWSEQYAPSVFAMDGSVEYTFDGSNNYQLHTYDALGGESHDYSGRYAIDLINKRAPSRLIRRCRTTAMSPIRSSN